MFLHMPHQQRSNKTWNTNLTIAQWRNSMSNKKHFYCMRYLEHKLNSYRQQCCELLRSDLVNTRFNALVLLYMRLCWQQSIFMMGFCIPGVICHSFFMKLFFFVKTVYLLSGKNDYVWEGRTRCGREDCMNNKQDHKNCT